MTKPLTEIEVRQRLEELLGAVLTSRRTVNVPAKQIATLSSSSQYFALHWAEVIAESNSEMAFQFVCSVPFALDLLGTDGATQWIIRAMDIYDRDGLYLGSESLRDASAFANELVQHRHSVGFDDVASIMNKFSIGLSGRILSIEQDCSAWTDTETIYLPKSVSTFDSSRQNFDLYKAMVGYLLAQVRYGTFRVGSADGVPLVCTAIASYQDQSKALRIFDGLEEIRLRFRLESELPGLARTMSELRPAQNKFLASVEKLVDLAEIQQEKSDVTHTLVLLQKLYPQAIDIPKPLCYQGRIDLERIRLTTRQRVESEREIFRQGLALLAESVFSETDSECVETGDAIEIQPNRNGTDVSADSDNVAFEINGTPIAAPSEMLQTATSIIQDFGQIPDEYLIPIRQVPNRIDDNAEQTAADGQDQAEHNELVYDEWDYRRGHYRKNWCVLREQEMHSGNAQIVDQILEEYSYLVSKIRRSFEVLRGDSRLLRRQIQGDDIDIDAVVEGYVDLVHGDEISERLFISSRRVERDLAVVFMVDVSGSTRGWINQAERESLVLLSEALEILGDRYSIYGFSGMTRKRCRVYRVKSFEEPNDETVKARIAGMKPQDYTRMGVVIRHLSGKLQNLDAKTRVLITISDGRPDDFDGYRGEYGIEDTRQALVEAKHAGIHPFCITIDSRANEYLAYMYGHVSYTVVNDIRKLPLKVSDIYRKLTS